jgi:hypothetical protein
MFGICVHFQCILWYTSVSSCLASLSYYTWSVALALTLLLHLASPTLPFLLTVFTERMYVSTYYAHCCVNMDTWLVTFIVISHSVSRCSCYYYSSLYV